MDIAERVKIAYGSLIYGTIKRTDEIDLREFDPRDDSSVLHDHVIEIVIARMDEILQHVRKELEDIGKAQLLPAGAVLVGGGANMVHVTEFSKDILQLPVHIGEMRGLVGMMDQIDDPQFATAVGLVLWDQRYGSLADGSGERLLSSVGGAVTGSFGNLKRAFEKFLP